MSIRVSGSGSSGGRRRLSKPMKKTPMQSATSLPPSPDDERRGRMLRYGITMTVRVICVVLLFFVHGWWLVVPAIGAIILPYVAVVFANTISRTRTADV